MNQFVNYATNILPTECAVALLSLRYLSLCIKEPRPDWSRTKYFSHSSLASDFSLFLKYLYMLYLVKTSVFASHGGSCLLLFNQNYCQVKDCSLWFSEFTTRSPNRNALLGLLRPILVTWLKLHRQPHTTFSSWTLLSWKNVCDC